MGRFGQNAAAITLIGLLMSGNALASDEIDSSTPELPPETLDQVAEILEECKADKITADVANDQIYELLVPHFKLLNPDLDILAEAAARNAAETEVGIECGPDETTEKDEPYVSPLEI